VKLLEWFRWSALGQRLPAWILNPIVYLIQHIYAWQQHRRNILRKDSTDPTWVALNELVVPPDERVAIPRVFVVELFPPSTFKQLKRAVKRNQWYAAQLGLTPLDPKMLEKARSGSGWSWWILGAMARHKSPPRVGDARRTEMPKEFDAVTARAFQIGRGITAVIACFYTSEDGGGSVNLVWHQPYGPEFVCGRRPSVWSRAETARYAAVRHTQLARESIHSAARDWLRRTAPGVFAAYDEPQPLLDILLFDKREVDMQDDTSGREDDAYEALGLKRSTTLETSEQIPGMNLERADSTPGQYVDGRRTWALWGQRQAIEESIKKQLSGIEIKTSATEQPVKVDIGLDSYGRDTDDAIARYIQDEVEYYLVGLSLSELLAVFSSRYSAIRDNAATRYRRFRIMKHLKELRSDLVTTSMNVSSVEQDIRDFNNANSGFRSAPVFILRNTSAMQTRMKKLGWTQMEPIDTNARMSEERDKLLTSLASTDKRYREILTAAASLTSSMRTMLVSTTSLAVAALAFLLSDTVKHTVLPGFLHFISTLAVAVGGSSPPSYSAPQSLVVSDDAVAKVVHDAIDGDRDAAKLSGSPEVNCTGETTCTIAYTVQKSTGFNSDTDLLYPTRQIWKALFTDPQFQSGTMNISGPVTSVGGKSETASLLTLTCDRNAASQIDWDKVDGDGFRTLCGFQAHGAGLPGGPTTGPRW